MKRNRWACLLALILALTTVVGCVQSVGDTTAGSASGSSSEAGASTGAPAGSPAESAETQTEFKLMAPQRPDQGNWNDYWIFNKIEEEIGITFNIETIDSQGWRERLSLAFASDDIPDVFVDGLDNFDLINYSSTGKLIPLEGLLENAPNIKSLFEEYPNFEKSLRAMDGSIYGVPSVVINEREFTQNRCFINKQWLDNLGLEEPQTLDELTTVLTAFKEGDANGNGDLNDEIPFGGHLATGAATNSNTPNMAVLSAVGLTANRLTVKDGEVIYAPAEEAYKTYLETMNSWYKSGIIDPQYFTQTEDQFTAKGAEGLYGMFTYAASWVLMSDEALYSQYKGFSPVTSDINDTKMWPGVDFSGGGMFAITNKAKSPEKLVEWLNWSFSPEGSIATRVGPEDGTWEGGVGGYKWIKNEDGLDCFELIYPEEFDSFNQFRSQKITPMSLPYADTPTTKVAQYITSADPRQVLLTSDIVENQAPYYAAVFPKVFFTKEENDEINLIRTDLDSYADQMEARFIIGDEPLENWETFLQGMKDRQLDRYLELNKTAYDRWKNS